MGFKCEAVRHSDGDCYSDGMEWTGLRSGCLLAKLNYIEILIESTEK